LAYGLFDEFAQSIKEHNRMEELRYVVLAFVWFWDNNGDRLLEVRWPIAQVKACIGDVQNSCHALIVSKDSFEILLGYMIRTRGGVVLIFLEGILDFLHYKLVLELKRSWS